MYAFTQNHHVSYADVFRWTARVAGVILCFAWLGFAITEVARTGFRTLSVDSSYQAAAFVLVFIGYAVGWRRELFGGLVAIIGTASYFLLVALTIHVLPGIEAAWFAAPGVLYLLTWQCDRRNVHDL
jgi:hypothetical protein